MLCYCNSLMEVGPDCNWTAVWQQLDNSLMAAGQQSDISWTAVWQQLDLMDNSWTAHILYFIFHVPLQIPIPHVPISHFSILQITIHSESSRMSCSQETQLCYNSQQLDNRNPDASDLLTAFNFGRWRGYCLAHLFTYRDFQSGLLGLANIASPMQGQTGGVCSRGMLIHAVVQ